MRPPSIRAVASATALFCLAGLGCGGGSARPGGNRDGGGGVDAAPLPATPGGWTWIDVPGMGCDDGSGTGVAINPMPPGGGGGALYVYFMGGGACWDASTCFVLNTAVHGPFGQAQWDATAPAIAHPLDRARATNPFRDASYVFVPYCTGDLHAGTNVATYDVLGPRMFAHVGRRNVEALLPRLRATWPAPARVVISGSSAGGYGATLNYDLLRRAYPDAQVALVDDAGPLLEGDGIPADHRAAWYANWHLGDVVDPLCPDCRGDLSRLYPALVAKYPQDRMALLTSLQDSVIRTYFLILLGIDFEQRLRSLVTNRFAPTETFRTFAIPGESHTLLGAVDTITSGGVTLEAWLAQMLTGNAAWASVGL
jgi:pectinacetylesterase